MLAHTDQVISLRKLSGMHTKDVYTIMFTAIQFITANNVQVKKKDKEIHQNVNNFSLKYILVSSLCFSFFAKCSIMIIHYLDNQKTKHFLKITVTNGKSNLH